MILEQLTLRNFGLYRGEQVFHLRPTSRNGQRQPIILFGGINGGGKTTLFDAVQLALYGSRGNYLKRSHARYDEFLKESIHRGVKPSEGASVGLTFRISSGGEENVYEVCRTWSQHGRTLRENLHVFKDGVQDQHLAEHWTDLVEEVIPLGVSQLFFFDAEKVRLLAENEDDTETIGSAIKSLLGLDLAERLIADADVLESRLAQRIASESEPEDYLDLRTAFEAKDSELRDKKVERASLENRRLRAEKKLKAAEAEFAKCGGRHWKQRNSRKAKLAELRVRDESLQQDLLGLSAGPFPLALVSDLMKQVVKQDRQDQASRDTTIILNVLSQRDGALLRALKRKGVSKKAVETVSSLQKADREKRKPAISAETRHALSDTTRQLLLHLTKQGLSELSCTAEELLAKKSATARKRESLERTIKQTPKEADIAVVVERLNKTTKESAILEDRAHRLDEEIRILAVQKQEITSQLQKHRRATVEDHIQLEESARMAALAIRTQETMKQYLGLATANKIDQLSSLVSNSFRFLLRKNTLVERVEIDPDTFCITLSDNDGNVIPKKRLSEGEKQIFAISLLWGLAQASPRPLPAIIDTPMARLDAEHRSHLVERYFPRASHQVIILSTDTEVDQHFYADLKPHIARAYHLSYNDKAKKTTVEEGYFWPTKPSNSRKKRTK